MTDALSGLTEALADRYAIERELGAGGMATVYLAHDVRHDRQVALKVLRPELAAILGGERFLKEIRLTANLQHPHILPLHDSGEAGGMVYYVMPFVEGESLRDRLLREHQLPVDEAVRITTEVADALAYAHGQGVIHRDIKPENILLHGGHALVADFGIALAASRSEGSTRMTETGMSLGTPAYMAPEQAMGEREITPKVDVYALGAVLYEMLSGEPPFVGPTAQAIIARVMTEEPRALSLHRHTIPAHVEAATRKALEKLPADRFPSAAEFAAALANPAFGATGTTSARTAYASPGGRPDWRARLTVPALAAAAVMAIAAAWALLRPAPPMPVSRFGLALPASQTPDPTRRIIPSPDGSHLLFVAAAAAQTGLTQLWLKAGDAYAATPLAGTLGVWIATFSPDGKWVAFIQDGHLKKLAVSGGSAITLADSAAPGREGIAWLDDGSIVYVQLAGIALRRVPEVGGTSTAAFPSVGFPVSEPTPLPGGRGVLFGRCSSVNCDGNDLWALDLRSGAAHLVLPGALMGLYLPSGDLLYVRADGAAFTIPFSLRSLTVRGSPVPVLDSVATDPGYPLLAVSASGTLVMRTGAALAQSGAYEMVWIDRSGRATPIDMGGPVQINVAGGNPGWALSPDGTRLALALVTASGSDIWIKQLPTGPLSRVTFDSLPDERPRWMPGGHAFTYIAFRGNEVELRRAAADGTGGDSLLAHHAALIFEGAVSPDGRWIVTRIRGGLGHVGRDIVGFHVGGDTAAVPLIASAAFDENAFALSPDGRWIAYESDETGRREVYIRPFPATDQGKWQASTSGGSAPLWARNGRELFFVDVARQMTVVPFAAGAPPRLGERRPLFRLAADVYFWDNDYYTPWDISLDGQRFLMARRLHTQAEVQVSAPLIVAEHWFTELGQLTRRR